MIAGDVMYLVLSNAGYGVSVRSLFKTEAEAKTKMERLGKKGHTAVQYFPVVLGTPTSL